MVRGIGFCVLPRIPPELELELEFELELEQIQTHMTQKPVLRAEIGACRFAQQTGTAKRLCSAQLVERPSMRRLECLPLLALLAASRAAGALAVPLS